MEVNVAGSKAAEDGIKQRIVDIPLGKKDETHDESINYCGAS